MSFSAPMHKMFRFHPRLFASLLAGAATYFVLPLAWSPISRLLVSWNCAAILLLTLLYAWMTSLSAERIRSHYIDEDPSAPFILVVVVVAALLSVVAIVEPLATLKQVVGAERVAHVSLALLTLLSSWFLVATMFTTHYADMFYSADEDARPLRFPGTPMPAFWDFAYFSFTIAAACQTADVATECLAVRRVVLAQTIVSFFFNVSILGFAINVSAGMIG